MFKCTFNGCDKKFKRKFHLTRHYKNHEMKNYQCTWPKCNRKFFRKDLLRVHFNRHDGLSLYEKSYSYSEIDNQADMVLFDRRSNKNFTNNCLIVPFFPHAHSATKKKDTSDEDFYSWLFNNDMEDLYVHKPADEYLEFEDFFYEPDSLVRKNVFCDENIKNRLLSSFDKTQVLESLSCKDIELSLRNYWNDFHEDYPILHKATFDSEKAPTLLLLPMVVTGLEIASRKEVNNEKASILRKISVEIARPLHWQLHSNEYAQPPALLYFKHF